MIREILGYGPTIYETSREASPRRGVQDFLFLGRS